jgi:hypothetical protein
VPGCPSGKGDRLRLLEVEKIDEKWNKEAS